MDALFGLPRKKSAGQSFKDPVHGDLFFQDQQAVDEYISSLPSGRKADKVYYRAECCYYKNALML